MKGNLTLFYAPFSNPTKNKKCIKQPKNRVNIFIGGYTSNRLQGATIGFKISIHQNKDRKQQTPLRNIKQLTGIKIYVMI